MALRGERFVIDFPEGEGESEDEDEDEDQHQHQHQHQHQEETTQGRTPKPSIFTLGHVVERNPSTAKPPSAPSLRTSVTGFPEHKKRRKVSAFMQQRASTMTKTPNPAKGSAAPINTLSQPFLQANGSSKTGKDASFEEMQRQEIDKENTQRLAALSAEEIEQERKELLANLSPSTIENLLKMVSLSQGRGDTSIDAESVHHWKDNTYETSPAAPTGVTHATAIPEPATGKPTVARTVRFDDDVEPADAGILRPASDFSREAAMLADRAIHFPAAPSAPDLDPSDPSFLESLHTKYFPSLPADPLKLAWMAPVPSHGSPADQDSPYYPGQSAMPASALRFDFRGALLPPRIARAMPTTMGLHHHGEAPEAAGYTLPELARLARSVFPAQRCIAFQTLGRVLYRLGRGEWGDQGSEMTMGLWRCVDEGKVIETLEEAAAAEGGHQGSKVYAVEAVWLWQKGGGKKWKAS